MKALPFLFLLLIVRGLYSQSNDNDAVISGGVIDLHLARLAESSQRLKGSCEFYENRLLTPDECKNTTGKIIDFPSLLNENLKNDAGLSYATYALTILLPNDQTELGLSLPQMYSSYKLWVNNEVIAENGVIGKTKEEYRPQWKPQTVSFKVKSDTLRLVLQIANFHHAKGGIKEHIYLGNASLMEFKSKVSSSSKLVEAAALFLIGFVFLMIFLFHQVKKVSLYFSLLCITWAIRSLFSNSYLFISYFPDFDWTTMVRIEYISLYLSMIWAILFLSSIFHNESNVILKYALVICNILFVLFSVSSSPRVFTQGLNVYLITSGILLLYGVYIIIRAWVNERSGSGLLTISIILGVNIFGYDIFVYEGFSSYDPVVFSAGYIFIFMLMGFGLASHLNLIKGKEGVTTRLTYDDLYKDQPRNN